MGKKWRREQSILTVRGLFVGELLFSTSYGVVLYLSLLTPSPVLTLFALQGLSLLTLPLLYYLWRGKMPPLINAPFMAATWFFSSFIGVFRRGHPSVGILFMVCFFIPLGFFIGFILLASKFGLSRKGSVPTGEKPVMYWPVVFIVCLFNSLIGWILAPVTSLIPIGVLTSLILLHLMYEGGRIGKDRYQWLSDGIFLIIPFLFLLVLFSAFHPPLFIPQTLTSLSGIARVVFNLIALSVAFLWLFYAAGEYIYQEMKDGKEVHRPSAGASFGMGGGFLILIISRLFEGEVISPKAFAPWGLPLTLIGMFVCSLGMMASALYGGLRHPRVGGVLVIFLSILSLCTPVLGGLFIGAGLGITGGILLLRGERKEKRENSREEKRPSPRD